MIARVRSGEPDAAADERTAGAVRRAVRFLADMQEPAGCWIDFEVDRADESDAWVTGYAGTALRAAATAYGIPAGAPLDAAASFLRTALRERAGWGFNGDAPPDADSTAWALIMLHGAGGAPAAAAAALRAHRRADGGFSTYLRFSDPSMWRETQADVTAAALFALLGEPRADRAWLAPAADYLRARQAADGGWESFWYATPVFAALHAVHALARFDAPAAPGCRAGDAVRFALRTVQADDPFALGCTAELVLAYGDPSDAWPLIRALVALQRPDGRWTAARPFMRPDPWNYAAGDPDAAIADKYGVFTTATVLRALAAARASARDDRDA